MPVYELFDEAGAFVEYRSYPEPVVVGVGGAGEFARMREVDPSALPASPPVPPTPREWLDRLSADAQTRIWTSAAASPLLLGLVVYAAGGPTVNVKDPKTAAGVQAMLDAGAITADEAAALLK